MNTEIYTLQTLWIKIVQPFLRSNPIGHMIFFTHEKYRMTNHKPDTIFLTIEENRNEFYRQFTAISSSLVAVNTNTA